MPRLKAIAYDLGEAAALGLFLFGIGIWYAAGAGLL
ncbi:hypothetical protein QO011_005816 [Labrys wisconsinensis]|uniref:Uncharacterized protein n=1 Tax=Labrys wisconsinensis TaxID=425677 RepID=A0ABU0JH30_9HYPH|nr:hypothetical protein [Labrys wisconsinensis]